jgi:hypothetical protein
LTIFIFAVQCPQPRGNGLAAFLTKAHFFLHNKPHTAPSRADLGLRLRGAGCKRLPPLPLTLPPPLSPLSTTILTRARPTQNAAHREGGATLVRRPLPAHTNKMKESQARIRASTFVSIQKKTAYSAGGGRIARRGGKRAQRSPSPLSLPCQELDSIHSSLCAVGCTVVSSEILRREIQKKGPGVRNKKRSFHLNACNSVFSNNTLTSALRGAQRRCSSSTLRSSTARTRSPRPWAAPQSSAQWCRTQTAPGRSGGGL